MVKFLLRRLIAAFITLIVASFTIFTALNLARGDPAALLAGNKATPAMMAAIRKRLGLDVPLPSRYWSWLSSAAHGNFGTSYEYHQSVASLLVPRIGVTAMLVIYATLIVIVFGIGLSILSTVIKAVALPVTALSAIGIAIPSFVAATLLIAVFAVHFTWFPVLGGGTGFIDMLYHLTLPAVALALSWTAYVTQISRTALRAESASEHVETEIVRGLAPSAIFRRHILRNAAIPIVTVTGLTFGGLIVGTVIIEQAFGISGVGAFFVQAVSAKDAPVVETISMIFVASFIIINTCLDLAHAALDPRIRSGVHQ